MITTLIERLEKLLIYKVIDNHIRDLEELSDMVLNDNKEEIEDLIEDYKITKQVHNKYYAMFGIVS